MCSVLQLLDHSDKPQWLHPSFPQDIGLRSSLMNTNSCPIAGRCSLTGESQRCPRTNGWCQHKLHRARTHSQHRKYQHTRPLERSLLFTVHLSPAAEPSTKQDMWPGPLSTSRHSFLPVAMLEDTTRPSLGDAWFKPGPQPCFYISFTELPRLLPLSSLNRKKPVSVP
jgi:hypothetical protein